MPSASEHARWGTLCSISTVKPTERCLGWWDPAPCLGVGREVSLNPGSPLQSRTRPSPLLGARCPPLPPRPTGLSTHIRVPVMRAGAAPAARDVAIPTSALNPLPALLSRLVFACWSSPCAVCQGYCCPPQPQSGSMGTGITQKLILILISRVSLLTINLLTRQSESLPVQAKQLCEADLRPCWWGFLLVQMWRGADSSRPCAAPSISWLSLGATGEPPGPVPTQ